MGSSEDAPRRYVVGIGIGKYENTALNLPQAHQDAEDMTAWFERGTRVRHERALVTIARDPSWAELQSGLSEWLDQRDAGDVVVIYIAAHGQVENGVAYVQGRDSPRDKVAGRAVDARTLGAIIGQSKPHNVLIIVDACVAGVIGRNIQRSAEDSAEQANSRETDRPYAQMVLCSTYGRDPAHDGKFVEAFLRVVSQERYTGTSHEWIYLDQMLGGLRSELQKLKVPQVADGQRWGPGEAALIPNPHYATRHLGALVADVELDSHFDPAARGVSRGEVGSYFTGREPELRRIVDWLAVAPDGDVRDILVITGSPGSGKSALLSRVVVLSNSELRAGVSDLTSLPQATVPPEGSLDAVLWCRGKSLDQIAIDLSARLNLTARTPAEVVAAVSGGLPVRGVEDMGTRPPLTIAIDSLDEASEGESERIATELIRPLVETRGIKVLVATRPHQVLRGGDAPTSLLTALGVKSGDPNCIVLDAADDIADKRRYVVARLMASAEPARHTAYRGHDDLAKRLAERIVAASGRSYLVAAITARAYSNRAEPVDVSVTTITLPAEAGAALAGYIAQLPEPQLVEDVLRPLAWAEGPGGLPWGPVWCPLVNALAAAARSSEPAPVYTDASIAIALDRASDLVVESSNRGEPVYRLFHEALAEHLRSGVSAPAANAAIARALDALVGDGPWETVHPYVLAHLGTYLSRTPEGLSRLLEIVSNPDVERAHRLRLGHSAAFLKHIDLAIGSTLSRNPVDWPSLGAACLVYSRQVAFAPALVVDIVAKAGLLLRAELMANNLTFAVERAWAYALLAPTFAQERDVDGAQRCLAEAGRACAAIDLTHAGMAWSWIATAAQSCGFADLAKRAAVSATQAAITRAELTASAGGPDKWDVSTALFWAGAAARTVRDEQALEKLRVAFSTVIASEEAHGTIFRNQELQAASVLGFHDLLRRTQEALLETRSSGSSVRDGNLALALASAGLTSELHALFDAVDSEGGQPIGEVDARKRYAWALALDHRFDRALQCVTAIDDEEERARALRRVAGELTAAKVPKADPAVAKATAIADALAQSAEPKVATLLASVFDRLGDQDRASRLAEDVIRAGFIVNANNCLAFRKPDVDARRPLTTDIAALSDQQAATESAELAQTGHLPEAIAKLAEVRISRFRWEALFWIAWKAAELGLAEAAEYWGQALVEARLVGNGLVMLTAQFLAKELASKAERGRFIHELNVTQKRWTESAFVEQYEQLRASLDPGSARTARLDDLMSITVRDSFLDKITPRKKKKTVEGDARAAVMWSMMKLSLWPSMSTIASMVTAPIHTAIVSSISTALKISELSSAWSFRGMSWTDDEIAALVRVGSPGQRMFALLLMRQMAGMRWFELLCEIVADSRSAYEQYNALALLKEIAPKLTGQQRTRTREILARERTRYIRPATDRALLAREIEELLDNAEGD